MNGNTSQRPLMAMNAKSRDPLHCDRNRCEHILTCGLRFHGDTKRSEPVASFIAFDASNVCVCVCVSVFSCPHSHRSVRAWRTQSLPHTWALCNKTQVRSIICLFHLKCIFSVCLLSLSIYCRSPHVYATYVYVIRCCCARSLMPSIRRQ